MALYDDVKAAAAALHRLSQAEKALIQQTTATDAALSSVRREITELRERMIRIEARFDAFEELTTARMQAIAGAAIVSAISALAGQVTATDRRQSRSGTSDPASGGRKARPRSLDKPK